MPQSVHGTNRYGGCHVRFSRKRRQSRARTSGFLYVGRTDMSRDVLVCSMRRMVLVVVPVEGLLACMSAALHEQAVFAVADTKTLAWWFSKMNVQLQNRSDQKSPKCL